MLELSGRFASKTDTSFLALIPVFTGIVADTDRSDTDVLSMSPNLSGNSTFVFANSPGYFGEILLGIKHQLNGLPVLKGQMFSLIHLGTSLTRDAATLRYHICHSYGYF
jgi:hypothetical protein